jgi:hypothetical protein
MGDFNLYSQNARSQRQAFTNAESTNSGYLGTSFENISQGDIVFNANASHVMVATGQTQIQVIHAPQTGEYVTTEWRNVGDNWSYGHTFRNTDTVLPDVEITPQL